MKNVKFKPKIDKLFLIILIPTAAILLLLTAAVCIFSPVPFAIIFTVSIDLFVAYFLISPLFGYAELREEFLFIKFGFILKREIPYSKIRDAEKVRKWYADSMLSLKNSMEHVNVKYNRFDMLSISVNDNDTFILELKKRI